MSTSFGALCDDFYVNMNLRTQLELPRERDTLRSSRPSASPQTRWASCGRS